MLKEKQKRIQKLESRLSEKREYAILSKEERIQRIIELEKLAIERMPEEAKKQYYQKLVGHVATLTEKEYINFIIEVEKKRKK